MVIPGVVFFTNDQLIDFAALYGLIEGKYTSICAMEIQKIQMLVHDFSGFALFTEL